MATNFYSKLQTERPDVQTAFGGDVAKVDQWWSSNGATELRNQLQTFGRTDVLDAANSKGAAGNDWLKDWYANNSSAEYQNVWQTKDAPTQSSEVTPYLNAVQDQEFKVLNQPDVIQAKSESDQALAALNNPNLQTPTAPNLEQKFGQLREQYDVGSIEKDLTDLKTEEERINAELRVRSNNEKGQRVGMGVISGRVSEIEQQAREDLDFVQRQINTKTSQVQAAYSLINTIMNFSQTDFQNSMQIYNTEYNKAIKTYEIARDNYRDIRDFKQKEIARAEDSARANLQIYANMITSGSLQYDKLDGKTQAEIAKLEVSSGLGAGFIKSLDIPLSARIKEIGTRVDGSGNKYADTIIVGKDGSLSVQSVYLGKEYVASMYSSSSKSSSASSTAASSAQKAAADAQKNFWSDVDNTKKALRDGGRWGELWNTLKAKYPGVSNADIDAALGVPRDWIQSGKPGYEWWYQNNS